MRKRAFTLIELLVVVAIIAVLIAILLPSLGRAKANAVRVKCAAQLRQWGMVIHMYAQENQDWFGAYMKDASGNNHYWASINVSQPDIYASEWSNIDPNLDPNVHQSRNSIIFRTCPGDPTFGQYAAAGAGGDVVAKAGARPNIDYAMPRYLPLVSGSLMWRTTQFNHPNSTVLLSESPTIQYGVGNGTMKSYSAFASVGMPPQFPATGDLDSEPNETLSQALEKRHMGIGNVLFQDAHVEQHKYADWTANVPNVINGLNAAPNEANKTWITIAQ
jgi:prepilin-type N-terminal cleavage/methylation domain-containing protein/prepilin-type processing-associated H-X9-DG protein